MGTHSTNGPVRWRRAGAALAATIAAAAIAGPASAAPTPTTVTFTYTGAPQSWTVPAGMSSATFDLYGAQGENAPVGGAAGGQGAHVRATLAVAPGDTLQITVGGRPSIGSLGGYNGGGPAFGGGGGGASDVRNTQGDRLLVAAGGGGGGACGSGGCVPGGAGGGSATHGSAGTGFTSATGGGGVESTYGGGGGEAGTDTDGGRGGLGGTSLSTSPGAAGTDGTLGKGGVGGSGGALGGAGGGGGGGYYGGGGGGGGGSSNFIAAGAGGGGGGGGSNLVPLGGTAQNGTREGDGMVTITYTLPYAFTGFFAPVDNPTTTNTVKAGSSVPVKFSLAGNQGLSIFAANSPYSEKSACDFASTDEIEQTAAAGASGLQYNALTDTYTYVWQTEKSWVNTCRILHVALNDGTDHVARFMFH